MNPKIKNLVTILISICIAGGLMYLALSGLSSEQIHKIKSTFVRANYSWVAMAAFFGVLAYWIRAIRWNLLLEPMGYKISNFNALWSLSFGYFMNLGIPRSGELARATILNKVENVPIDKSFGTIVTERIVDLLFMFLFLLFTAIFNYKALYGFFDLLSTNKKGSHTETNFLFFIYLMILGGLVFGLIIFIFRKKIDRIKSKIKSITQGIFSGISSITKLQHSTLFILLSFGIWICYFFACYLITYALPETSFLKITDGFFLITIGTLGMIVPASGGFGAYHTAMKIGFAAMFLSLGKSIPEGESVGLSYAFLSHTMQFAIMLIMGLLSILFLAKKTFLKLNGGFKL